MKRQVIEPALLLFSGDKFIEMYTPYSQMADTREKTGA